MLVTTPRAAWEASGFGEEAEAGVRGRRKVRAIVGVSAGTRQSTINVWGLVGLNNFGRLWAIGRGL